MAVKVLDHPAHPDPGGEQKLRWGDLRRGVVESPPLKQPTPLFIEGVVGWGSLSQEEVAEAAMEKGMANCRNNSRILIDFLQFVVQSKGKELAWPNSL